MFYTRRKLLRDAATASLAATASSAFPVLSQASPRRAASFPQGVRIFFIGTWLFCKDPQPGKDGKEQMLAITLDHPPGHDFPYGPWMDAAFDKNARKLLDNVTEKERAFRVAVNGFTPQYTTTQKLFDDASSNCEFISVRCAQGDSDPMIGQPDVRAISIPLPTNLYTGVFINGHTISTADSNTYKITGNRAATGHVFEYEQGAIWAAQSSNAINSTVPDGFQGSFHFRTVPTDCMYHGPEMLTELLHRVFNIPRKEIQLNPPCEDDTTTPCRGKYLPSSVTNDELDIIKVDCIPQPTPGCPSPTAQLRKKDNERIFFRTTAACAGAGMGVLGA